MNMTIAHGASPGGEFYGPPKPAGYEETQAKLKEEEQEKNEVAAELAWGLVAVTAGRSGRGGESSSPPRSAL